MPTAVIELPEISLMTVDVVGICINQQLVDFCCADAAQM